VLYTLDNSKALLVLTHGFPDEGTPEVPKHDTCRKEIVHRLCLLLVHEQLVRHTECEIMHGHTAEIPSTYEASDTVHTHTHTQPC
jgi:hypothetical protein